MLADRPKQYLPLGRQTLLERAAQCLLADGRVERVAIVIAKDDPHAAALRLPARCEWVRDGGASRAETVRNGLRHLRTDCRGQDWVLVHDAARPCLGETDLAALIDTVGDDVNGGLLAAPASDTMKRGQDGRVAQTVERATLWRALTPQYFRIDILARALESEPRALAATDESAAMESLGFHPRLVAGASSNLKVTVASDLLLAEAILREQGRW
jgi:2-C-methyl-D-erythritol 4-phosphate cytidylyltransferase